MAQNYVQPFPVFSYTSTVYTHVKFAGKCHHGYVASAGLLDQHVDGDGVRGLGEVHDLGPPEVHAHGGVHQVKVAVHQLADEPVVAAIGLLLAPDPADGVGDVSGTSSS